MQKTKLDLSDLNPEKSSVIGTEENFGRHCYKEIDEEDSIFTS
jgi:hypothetical protein